MSPKKCTPKYILLNITASIIKADNICLLYTSIGLKIDQTLTQDATGTMAYLEFEAMGIPRVKTERSVAYIDHNTLQSIVIYVSDRAFSLNPRNSHSLKLEISHGASSILRESLVNFETYRCV